MTKINLFFFHTTARKFKVACEIHLCGLHCSVSWHSSQITLWMDRRGSFEKGHKRLKTLQPSARSFLNLPPLLLARAVGLQHLWWGVGWGAEVRSDLEAHHSTENGISNLGIEGWQKSLAGPLTTVLLSALSSYRPAPKQPHPVPRPAPITYAK